MFRKESRFQSFLAREKIKIYQLRPVEKVELGNVGQAEQGVKIEEFNVGIGFFYGFSSGPLGCGLAVFKISGRQGPIALSGCNRAFTQKHFVFKKWQATGYHLGVLVMDGCAGCTNISWAVVPFGDDLRHGVAALATIFHVS